MLGISQLLFNLLLELLDLVLQLLLLLQHLLDSLLQLMLLVLRGRLLCQNVLLKDLQLSHIMLKSSKLLLVSNGILLQNSQSSLVLLLDLALLQDLLLQLLVQLLQLLQLSQLLTVLLEGSLQLALFVLVSGRRSGSGLTGLLLLTIHLAAGFGFRPLARRQIGQVGHVANRRRSSASRRSG